MFERENDIRLAFQNLFVTHPDGYVVLAEIRNRLGTNATAPDLINPDLIAFEHWLLTRIGIKHERNIKEETLALLSAANFNDLVAMEKQAIKAKETEENAH